MPRKSLDHMGSEREGIRYAAMPKPMSKRRNRSVLGFRISDFGGAGAGLPFLPGLSRREREKAAEAATSARAVQRGGKWTSRARGTEAERSARPRATAQEAR